VADRAAVTVVGGGVHGCSVAFFLARRGITDVLVLEKEEGLGAGSTTKAAGGIRYQFSTEINIRLSQESIPFLERFEAETGSPFRFHQLGYLLLGTTPADLEEFRRNVRLQQSLGVPVKAVTPDECRQLVPAMNPDGVLGGTFCPKDGYGDPYELVQGFARAARERGVRFETSRTVTGLRVRGGRVAGVETSRGPVESPVVVLCTGAWSGKLGEEIGIDIPIRPFRRDVFVTGSFPAVGHPLPMVIEYATGFYFHSEGDALLFGMADKDEPSTFSTAVRWTWLPRVLERLVHRLPVAADAEVQTAWAGLYEVTPDAHPILGPVPEVEGLFIDAGYSGHGVMHAPAAGKLIAEFIADGEARTLDVSALSIERFRSGADRREQAVF